MPEVHFIGEIQRASLFSSSGPISLTYAIVPGNASWFNKDGSDGGETQICDSSSEKKGVLNHPLDVHYVTPTSEGWPFLVCEIWERDLDDKWRSFKGCGCAFLPTTPGAHKIELTLWRPCELSGLEGFKDMVLPEMPNLRHLRELVCSPFTRSEVQTETCGLVTASIHTVTSGFREHGVLQ